MTRLRGLALDFPRVLSSFDGAACDCCHAPLTLRLVSRWPCEKACELSGGNKRKLSVAIAMIGDPRVIFLDVSVASFEKSTELRVESVVRDHKQRPTFWMDQHGISKEGAGLSRSGQLCLLRQLCDNW